LEHSWLEVQGLHTVVLATAPSEAQTGCVIGQSSDSKQAMKLFA